jgi:hypothetical protein
MEFLKELTLKKRLLLLVSFLIFPIFIIVLSTFLLGIEKLNRINVETDGLFHIGTHSRLVLLIQQHRGLEYLYINGYKTKEVESRLLSLESEISSIFSKCISHCNEENDKKKLEDSRRKISELTSKKNLYLQRFLLRNILS